MSVKHCWQCRAASQRLGILRKSWRVFHDRLLLWRCFRGFVLPVLEYCIAVWCSTADTHLKVLDRVISGASILTYGGVECSIAYHRSVAVLCCWTRSGVTRFTWGFYLGHMCQCGYTRFFGRTSVYLRASSLQNLEVR